MRTGSCFAQPDRCVTHCSEAQDQAPACTREALRPLDYLAQGFTGLFDKSRWISCSSVVASLAP